MGRGGPVVEVADGFFAALLAGSPCDGGGGFFGWARAVEHGQQQEQGQVRAWRDRYGGLGRANKRAVSCLPCGHTEFAVGTPVREVSAEPRWPVAAADRGNGRLALASHRPLGEAAVLQQPIVQNQRAGYREIEREAGGNAHDMAAARQHRRRQSGSLRPEHVGSVQRMAERRQVGGVVQQFDADQHAALRQGSANRRSAKRHSGTCSGVSAVSACRPARASKPAPTMKQNAAPKAWAVRSKAPTLADLDTPSTPMPK